MHDQTVQFPQCSKIKVLSVLVGISNKISQVCCITIYLLINLLPLSRTNKKISPFPTMTSTTEGQSLLGSNVSESPTSSNRYLSKMFVLGLLVLYLGGFTIQNTVLQFWGQTFPKGSGGPYFILCWASLLFTIFFGIMFLVNILLNKPTLIPAKEYMGNYFLQGLANALNGVFIVYASPITRTPPIIFSVLINSAIFFGMILTKYIIPKKRDIKYMHKQIIASLGLLVASVILTVFGQIYSQKGEETNTFGAKTVFWMFILLLASFFLALYNVLQERYIGMTSTLLPDQKSVQANLLQTLFYTSLVQLILMAAFFWVDIVPGFGFSDGLPNFAHNFSRQVQCFFFSEECGYKCFLFGILFVIGYITVYLSGIILNRDSANFVIYVVALQTPLAVLVFILTGLGTSNVPLWSVIPSMIFIGLGIFLWKKWQQKQQVKEFQQQ